MFHKEGYKIIFISLVSFVAAIILIDEFTASIPWLRMTLMLVVLFFFVMILQFFRNPKRTVALNESHIIAPVDGKVVVIEEVFEPEYFKDKSIKLSEIELMLSANGKEAKKLLLMTVDDNGNVYTIRKGSTK